MNKVRNYGLSVLRSVNLILGPIVAPNFEIASLLIQKFIQSFSRFRSSKNRNMAIALVRDLLTINSTFRESRSYSCSRNLHLLDL
ncbi:hypothetical protein [Parageobacillus sp. G301]|uniref:hypothetical protein n=1 Tax=Parageobacillus sp. G301 TaxID=2998290 RepID=UPI0025524931|nr:hypothetical protein [Parageobacillus sp. G301]